MTGGVGETSRRCAGIGFAALSAVLGAAPAHADIVDVSWDSSQRFQQQLTVAPQRLLELCDRLATGAKVVWKYESEVPLEFNVHFHDQGRVVFSAREQGVRSSSGVLDVAVDQHYCWTWKSNSSSPVSVKVELVKQR